jgi:type 1 glutamine amidotransferase
MPINLNLYMRLKSIIGFSIAALVLLAAVALPFTSRAAEAPKKIKVLLITGDDVGVHAWPEVSQAIKQLLVASGKFEVRVCEDPGILVDSSALDRYDVVFLAMYNMNTPTLAITAKNNLHNFLSGGKGLVISHLSSASFKEWPQFKKMCGRYWVMGTSGHAARGPFKAHIAMKDSPITKGLSDFEADDELYAKLQGDEPITVLVEAESTWSHKTEPLAFTVEYGKGRVFHETFGHDVRAVRNPNVEKLIKQGVEWAATGKVE